jgi:tRNA nucleotidyltransferase (CCA-adding enzyme)
MVQAGFRPVGQDFPVFLHPNTQAEYALARTERKSGHGYKGFVFHASPDVGLEDDLVRRDLTINAMAVDSDGLLHDPFAGQTDLAQKRLRHVSAAFAEDPVRLLRLARFLARWPDFTVDGQTESLCQDMVVQGEVDALVPERVWQELWRGLEAVAPQAMLAFLCRLNCYAAITGVTPPEPARLQMLAALRAAELPTSLLAAWLWGNQPQPPKLPLPREVTQWAGLFRRSAHQPPLHEPYERWPQALVGWAEGSDLFRQPDRLDPLVRSASILAAEASSPEAATRQVLWTETCRRLLSYPVGEHAQAAAREHRPVAEAVRSAREGFVAKCLRQQGLG